MHRYNILIILVICVSRYQEYESQVTDNSKNSNVSEYESQVTANSKNLNVSDQPCSPLLSIGHHSQLAVDGHLSFECDISTCRNVFGVRYEKTGIHNTEWTPVFKGFNKTVYYELDTGSEEYSLNKRYDYTTFPSEHILYINPLTFNDTGRWRCAVIDEDWNTTLSSPEPVDIVSSCIPQITEGIHSNLTKDGHTSFECDIATCHEVARIEYEKTDIFQSTPWTHVIEGTDNTNSQSFQTSTGYTLQNRYDYAAFKTEHILYINPLRLSDQGLWRCVVYERNMRASHSEAISLGRFLMDSNSDTNCQPKLSENMHRNKHINGHTFFRCDISTCKDVSKVQFEKTETFQSQKWTTVFRGIHNNTFLALKRRHEYATFSTEHILYIKPLHSEDQGNWRCVVFYGDNKRFDSPPMKFNFEIPETSCQPVLSERNNGQLIVDGYISLECDFSKCGDITRLVFEKTGVHKDRKWTSVYEGVSKINKHSLHRFSKSTYSLQNRTEYKVFKTEHILYINPLTYDDQGEWRCVVYGPRNSQTESQALNISIELQETPLDEIPVSRDSITISTVWIYNVATVGILMFLLIVVLFVAVWYYVVKKNNSQPDTDTDNDENQEHVNMLQEVTIL